MKKTIGVLGGMGPLATSKLFEMLVELTVADRDNEHAHIIIDNNTKITDRTDFILHGGISPINELKISQKRLEKAGADLIIMPCNTAHYFYEELIKTAVAPLLNMPVLAVKELAELYLGNNVGLLATSGTIDTRIYTNLFESNKINYILPSSTQQEKIMSFIYGIKADKYEELYKEFIEVLEELKVSGVDVFLFGCTELSVAAKIYNLKASYKLIDAMELLAKKALIEAGYKVKN